MNYITGDKELLAKLDKLKKTESKAAIRKGTRAGCKVILPTAKANAPVRTGQLAKGLKVRAIPRSRKYTGTQIKLDYTGPTYYGAFVEFGTHHIVARHFMEKAVDSKKQTAVNTAMQTIASEIENKMKG